MGIGKRVQSLREQKGLTKADLARVLEVSNTAVYNWETLETRPRGTTMAALCRVLGTTEDWLVNGGTAQGNAPAQSRTTDEVLKDAKEALASIVGVQADRVKVRFEVE